MLVLLHVVIALASVIQSSYLLFKPSKYGFRISGGLIGLTLATGTWLVVSTHSPLLQACTTGLIYLGIVLAILAGAWQRARSRDASD